MPRQPLKKKEEEEEEEEERHGESAILIYGPQFCALSSHFIGNVPLLSSQRKTGGGTGKTRWG